MKYLDWICRTQPALLQKLATGEAVLPTGIDVQPFDDRGFPPALIPLWYREGHSFFGLWLHWFCDREPVLVHLSPEAKFSVTEVARTPVQLVYWIVLISVTVHDGVTDDIASFWKACGLPYSELERIDQISEVTGDLPEGLLALEVFREKAPEICFTDGLGYRGQFPTLNSPIDSKHLSSICSLEIPENAKDRFRLLNSRPSWLLPGAQASTFDRLLDSGDLAGAWLSLNSNGWTYGEVRRALPMLVQKSGSKAFAELADCWLSLDQGEDNWGY